MPNLSEFLDYRHYLKAVYEEKKRDNPLISYRSMAMRVDIDTAQWYRVLNGDVHLPLGSIPKICEVFGLKGRKAEQFELLVRYGRARKEHERKSLMDRILACRDIERRRLQSREFRVFSRWFAPVVRSLACQKGMVDASAIAARLRPEVAAAAVAETLETLEQQGFLRPKEGGGWTASEHHLTAGGGEGRVEAVREYQRQVLGLAAEAIARYPREQRDITTMTISVDDAAMAEIADMVRECRRQIQRRVEECARPTRVAQMSFALFPVATTGGAS